MFYIAKLIDNDQPNAPEHQLHPPIEYSESSKVKFVSSQIVQAPSLSLTAASPSAFDTRLTGFNNSTTDGPTGHLTPRAVESSSRSNVFMIFS